MGSAITPFSIVSQEETRLRKFRRALRDEDQRLFDELCEHVRRNIQAAVLAAAPDPMEPMESAVLLMLVGMQKEIEGLKARVSEFESKDRFELLAP
jgi:hypothetical protein